jgi:23S rRNA pseudouridine1911/1915/1917 synthase
MIEAYVKRNVYVVHRLDTPVSGLLVFAKNKSAAGKLGNDFKERLVQKTYLAVSRHKAEKEEGEWEDSLTKMNVQNKSFLDESGKGKTAVTAFKWIESLEHVHLYRLTPNTGRHHQIRVQMAHHIGPVRGDRKYGDKRGNKDGGIDLHAWTLEFKHPSSGKAMKFTAPVPDRPPWKFFNSINIDTDV